MRLHILSVWLITTLGCAALPCSRRSALSPATATPSRPLPASMICASGLRICCVQRTSIDCLLFRDSLRPSRIWCLGCSNAWRGPGSGRTTPYSSRRGIAGNVFWTSLRCWTSTAPVIRGASSSICSSTRPRRRSSLTSRTMRRSRSSGPSNPRGSSSTLFGSWEPMTRRGQNADACIRCSRRRFSGNTECRTRRPMRTGTLPTPSPRACSIPRGASSSALQNAIRMQNSGRRR